MAASLPKYKLFQKSMDAPYEKMPNYCLGVQAKIVCEWDGRPPLTIFKCSSVVDNDITQGALTGRVLSTLVANALHNNSPTAKGLHYITQNKFASSG